MTMSYYSHSKSHDNVILRVQYYVFPNPNKSGGRISRMQNHSSQASAKTRSQVYGNLMQFAMNLYESYESCMHVQRTFSCCSSSGPIDGWRCAESIPTLSLSIPNGPKWPGIVAWEECVYSGRSGWKTWTQKTTYAKPTMHISSALYQSVWPEVSPL